jgi:hypothetical protein
MAHWTSVIPSNIPNKEKLIHTQVNTLSHSVITNSPKAIWCYVCAQGVVITANTPTAPYSLLITQLCVIYEFWIHFIPLITCTSTHTVCFFMALTRVNCDFLSQFNSIVQIFYEEQCVCLVNSTQHTTISTLQLLVNN